jgi:hypothetical protein
MKDMDNRKENVEMARKYYNEYLKLLQHYGMVSKPLKGLWKQYEKNPTFKPIRNEKIAEYKASKVLKLKI